MNETLYQFTYNFIINNIFDWTNLIIFLIFIIVGYVLVPKSTKSFIKSIFNKTWIILTFIFLIYSSIILFLLGRFEFYSYFNLSDVVGLVVFNYFIHIFNSYKLSFNYKFLVEMIKEAGYSLILTYLLKITTIIIKYLLGYGELVFNFNIMSDIILIFIMAVLIFPFMYIIAVVNEYYGIYNMINSCEYSLSILDIFKKCKISLQDIHEFKNRLIVSDDYLINKFQEYGDQEMFEFNNNFIYQSDKRIGRYEYVDAIPKCYENDIIEAFTPNHKIRYVVDYTNDDDYCNIFYFKINNQFLKMYLNSKKCYPLQVKPILIEFIFKNNITL